MCNEYAYQLAKALIYPELTVEVAADVINGNVYGIDIWDDICTMVGGWCNDHNVFVAWDKMGRPDEREYVEPDYDSERDPGSRRSMVGNARISAMAECVADALYTVVNEIIVNEGWKCVPIEEWDSETDSNASWLVYSCHALDIYTESYLIKPNGK